MKNFQLITLLCMCLMTIASLTANNLSSSVSVNTISAEMSEVVFNLPEYQIETTSFNNQFFKKIVTNEGLNFGLTGYPELPHFSATIAVPVNSEISIENVSIRNSSIIENINIFPVQNYQNQNRSFDYESSFYESKNNATVYPEVNYTVSDIHTVRDYQMVTVNINPMRFYPATKTLEVVEEIRLTIKHQTRDSSPVYNLRPKISRAFESIYDNLIENYSQIRIADPVYQEPSLLIIYGGNPDATLLNNLVVWKKQRGFYVTAVGTSTIGTSTTAIKTYIQNAYDTWDNPPEFIMLIGDTTGSYAIPTFTPSLGFGSAGAGDYPYTHLAGGQNNLLGDAFIGRLSVENNNHLTAMINKILLYEKNPLAAGEDWYNHNLLVGDSASSGISTYIVNRYIKSLHLDYDPAHTFTELYSSGINQTTMQNTMSSGILNFNYRGYFGMSGFNSTNVSALTNVNKLTNCVWLTCSTGAFGGSSIIEDVVRHTTSTGGLAGAITSIGMSTSSTHTAYNNALDGAIFYGLYPADMETVGQALLFSKLYLVFAYGGSELEAANSSSQWTNLMGDPSLNIFKTKPKTFLTTLPTSIPAGTQGLRFDVIDQNGNPVPEAWVTISKMDGSYISKAFSNEDGVAFLSVDPEQTGTLAIVISKAGFAPKIGGVASNTGSSVSVQNYLINDASGNNNQQINPGETIALSISVKNFTESAASNLTATLSSESDLITITNGTVNMGSIGADATQTFTDAFTFVVSPLTPDKSLLPLTVTITDGSETWISYLLPSINGVDIDVVSMSTSTGNNYVDIDVTTNISFQFINNGSYSSYDLNARLVSRSLFLSVTDSLAFIGNITPGQTVSNTTDPFSVHVLTGIIPGMTLRAELHLYNNAGYEEIIPIRIPVGNKQNTDPTGPCDYGYVIYDSNDTEYEDAPEYDWIEIKHIGQNTGIADVTGSQEEDSANVTLPFTATFYGQNYDDITICSNGWLVFGQTEQKDFRNLPIPGPIAPKAMIAAYWTDLVVGGSQGGGVYTYHDQEENAFIIQWEKAKLVTGYSYGGGVTVGDSVSFQVLIYDPQYHASSLGDSPIKIQYRRYLAGIPGSNSHPFNYTTIGFQDHTEKRGLTYVYNNEYSPGSSTLQSNMALLITQPYFMNEEPYMIVNQTFLHDENGNNVIEAGENVNIGVSLTNAGMIAAQQVEATISFNSEYIQVINASSDYPVIESMQTQSNKEYFTIQVSPDAPNNYQATGILYIEDNGKDWYRQITFEVKKPNLTYRSYLINDYTENNNGVLEEGENAKLIINLSNPSLLDILNVEATIQTSSPHLTINDANSFISVMKAAGIYQFVFDITVADNLSQVSTLPLHLTVNSQNAPSLDIDINLGVNQSGVLLQESFNSWLPNGWIIQYYSSSWASSETNNAGGTAPEAKFTGSSNTGTTRLISKTMDATEVNSVLLSFRHAANVTMPGATIGIATRAMYSPWQTVWSLELNESVPAHEMEISINNNHLGQNNFQISWFVEGNFNGLSEWFIDDIAVQTSFGNTSILTGKLNIADFNRDITKLRVKAGDYSTTARADSTYSLYLLPGMYPKFEVLDSFIEGNAYNNVSVESGELLEDYDFELYYRVPPTDLRPIVMENNTVELVWNHYYNHNLDYLSFSHFNVYRQINSMQFVKIGETTSNSYVDNLNTNNIYRYYVKAEYLHGLSDSTAHVYVDPNTVNESDIAVQPLIFGLQQNYPNPFNPTTNISFTIPEAGNVSVKIFNVKGQLVKNLKNDFVEKGNHTIQWHGDNDNGRPVGSGIYFIKVQDNKHSAVRKSLLLK